ncbi:MAG: sigma-70 family RNA polymerase sigma factor [Thermoanaerobaculia bacterium]
MSGEAASIERPRPGAETADVAYPAPSSAPTDGAPWDWEDLYSRLGRGLLALAERRFGLPREDAEEALQRAATAIVLAAPSVRNPEAYLTSVFLRECLGTWRRQVEIRRHESPFPEGYQKADDGAERIEVVCRFRKAFSLLSPYCRAVMRSCLLDGKPRVAAASSEATDRTAFRRYRKCLRTLANALG